MGLFQRKLAERRRQQHGAATLDITDLGAPDMTDFTLTVRQSTKREQDSTIKRTPTAKPIKTPPTCAACGVEVPGKKRKARYCLSCLKKRRKQQQLDFDAARRVYRAENRKMKPCAHCQTPMPVRGRAKYCSEPCREEVRRVQGREKWERKVSGRIDGGWIERERRFNAARKAAKGGDATTG